jgi:hypothetical protein
MSNLVCHGPVKFWRLAVASPSEPEFVHRPNPDGTTDSVCRKCFVTVASAVWEADLDPVEQLHVCDAFRLKCLEEMARNRRSRRNDTD